MKNFSKTRSFLKWPGGKYSIIELIRSQLPEGRRFVEPFVGAGNVFLNVADKFDSIAVSDANPDLIGVYRNLKSFGQLYISDCRQLFVSTNNNEVRYLELRDQFNRSRGEYERAVLFVYLNRHCFNGLFRYNKSGLMNTAFGKFDKPYFPESEFEHASQVLKKCSIELCGFDAALSNCRPGDVVFLDPPYFDLPNKGKSFTAYTADGFSLNDQELLAQHAKRLSLSGIPVLISNHDAPDARRLYKGSKITELSVHRAISCGKRERAKEITALFDGVGANYEISLC